MCGGAIISEFIPQRDARGKRGLCAEDLWPHPAAGFDDVVPAADGYEFTGTASFPHDQGNRKRRRLLSTFQYVRTEHAATTTSSS